MKRLKDLLSAKHLLLDTCIFIELQKSVSSEELKEFFEEVASAPCALLTIDHVYCEFLAFANTEREYQDSLSFLQNVALAIYPTKEDLYIANQIQLAIKNKDKNLANRVSLVDCLLGAVLSRYEGTLFLATTNHKDFPTFLYDRERIFGFENSDGNIQNICIIKFNKEKFNTWLGMSSAS